MTSLGPLLLIIISGFIFLYSSKWFRIHILKVNNQLRLLSSVIAGLFSFLATLFLSHNLSGVERIDSIISPIILFSHILFGEYFKLFLFNPMALHFNIFAVVIYAISFDLLLNLGLAIRFKIRNSEKGFLKTYKDIAELSAKEFAIKRFGDELDKLCIKLMYEKNIQDSMVMFNLKNGKVYVGFMLDLPELNNSNYVSCVPILSAYRKSESKQIIITNFYHTDLTGVLNTSEEDLDKGMMFELSLKFAEYHIKSFINKNEIISFSRVDYNQIINSELDDNIDWNFFDEKNG